MNKIRSLIRNLKRLKFLNKMMYFPTNILKKYSQTTETSGRIGKYNQLISSTDGKYEEKLVRTKL